MVVSFEGTVTSNSQHYSQRSASYRRGNRTRLTILTKREIITLEIYFSHLPCITVLLSFFTREPEKQVDLQLPKVQQEEYYGPEVVFQKPESSFQEKIVTLNHGAGEGGSVTFKKRKGTQDNSKIMKRRNDL